MRVLHLYSGNLYGGIERLLATFARERHLCPELQHDFALCFEGQLSEELRGVGVKVDLLGAVRMARPWTVTAARKKLSALLWRESYDVVICHAAWPYALFAPIIRRAGLPLIFWAHDCPTGKHWTERLARRTEPDLVIANSLYTQFNLPTLFPNSPVKLQYYPIPAPRILGHDRVREETRASLGASPETVVIAMTSRMERWKGHTLLLQALTLMREVPGWTCWIAGGAQREQEATYLNELKDIVRNAKLENHVQFIGQRSDVPRLLLAADIHCQPNIAPEPFGVAFVEALHAGLPIVTTALGGPLEIVDETCGRLTPPGNHEMLADALSALVLNGDARRKLGSNGPRRARELCDPAIVLRNLHEMLQHTVERRMQAVS